MKADIAALQRRVGVKDDGVFGPATLAAINTALDKIAPAPPAPAARKIGPRAVALMHHFEGCKLTAYKCPAGVWTIGWGNTFYEDGRKVQPGDTITQARADELFGLVVADFERGVERMAPGAPPSQFGAMVSFAYNVGLGALEGSTLLRKHKAGDIAGAAAEFLKWDKSRGQVMPGLTRRRQAERLLYLNDTAAFDKAIGYVA